MAKEMSQDISKPGISTFVGCFFYEQQLILVNKLTNMCCRWLNKAVALAGQIRLKQLGECERLVDVFLVNIFLSWGFCKLNTFGF